MFNIVEYIDESSIAHIFDLYFGEVASNLESNISHRFTVLLIYFPWYHLMNPLFLVPVAVEDRSTVLANLNKSKCGLYN